MGFHFGYLTRQQKDNFQYICKLENSKIFATVWLNLRHSINYNIMFVMLILRLVINKDASADVGKVRKVSIGLITRNRSYDYQNY